MVDYVMFFVTVMFVCGCFVPVKRLAGKTISEMTQYVLSATLNPTKLNSVLRYKLYMVMCTELLQYFMVFSRLKNAYFLT